MIATSGGLAQRLSEHSTIPVPVDKVAETQGWTVARESHNDPKTTCSGFALALDDMRVIGVNQRISPRRQRYAVAHSLGHALMHLKGARSLIVCYSLLLEPLKAADKSKASPDEEGQARAFAMDLLMPEQQLTAALRAKAPHVVSRDELIGRLAQDFEVSTEAMGYRLITLGLTAA